MRLYCRELKCYIFRNPSLLLSLCFFFLLLLADSLCFVANKFLFIYDMFVGT